MAITAGSDILASDFIDASSGDSDAGKGTKLDSTGRLDPSFYYGPSVITLTAGENLTADQPVYINSADSKPYVAHGFKETASAGTFTYPSTALRQVAKLSDTQFMVLSNSTNTLTISIYAKSAPGTLVDDATVATNFDNGNGHTDQTRPAATVCRLTDTTFVVFWKNTSSGSLRFRTGSISGSTITMDTDTAYSGSPDFCYGLTAVPGDADGKVVLTYFDAGGEPGAGSTTVVANLSYLTVTTNSVTVTANVNFSVGSGSFFAEGIWTNAAYSNGICYGLFNVSDSGGFQTISYSYIDISDNSTGANLPTLILETPSGSGTDATYAGVRPILVGHNGRAYYGYNQSVSASGSYTGQWVMLEISPSGCNNVFKHLTVAGGTQPVGGTTRLKIAGNECGIIIFELYNGALSGSAEIYFQRGKTYGFGATLTATDFEPDYANSWYSNTRDEIVILNGSTVKTWKLPTPVDGFVDATVTSGNSAKIVTAGQIVTSGLTANRKYYLKDAYTSAGDMSIQGTIPVGRATSTTQLLIDK